MQHPMLYAVMRDEVFERTGSRTFKVSVMSRVCKDWNALAVAYKGEAHPAPAKPLHLTKDVPMEDFQFVLKQTLPSRTSVSDVARILISTALRGSVAHLRWAIANVPMGDDGSSEDKDRLLARRNVLEFAIESGDICKAECVLGAYDTPADVEFVAVAIVAATMSGNVAMADWVWDVLCTDEHCRQEGLKSCSAVAYFTPILNCDFPMLEWMLAKGMPLSRIYWLGADVIRDATRRLQMLDWLRSRHCPVFTHVAESHDVLTIHVKQEDVRAYLVQHGICIGID